MIRIAVDGMGGDYAPEPIVKGTLMALEKFDNIEITLFGDETKMAPYLKQHPRLQVIHTTHFLEMGEKDPIRAYRKNKELSMFMAMQHVKDGLSDAVVSAGPTQALVVGGHFIIRRMASMPRVAIAPIVPSLDGRGRILLDSGANVDFKPEHLLSFAIYASIVANKVLKREKPQVALINIGTEDSKGRDFDKETFALLEASKDINFYGNLEPKEILTSEADIFLSDGFTSNIVMKTMEGTAKGMGMILKREIKSSIFATIGALFMRKALKRFKKSLDASEIGGALLMGFDGIVIKAQGASQSYGFMNGIRQAKEMVDANVIQLVSEVLTKKEAVGE
ncbi:phosphate acyltransferase PlsX [Peloplasma aerotolerans]|uniref:Phosphate acyltransferase n=1 Tax=Peloplasma aerotolerans TaxID=3044389 RepID=A0AAW6UCI4_9MOLU|nr:phosphate acyltransferase PlsX [Mariniplasma sp. M4Ah]MDI6452683.1 phosphate acyltransferase PlsX [Mariniplasma sp. M4Ah]